MSVIMHIDDLEPLTLLYSHWADEWRGSPSALSGMYRRAGLLKWRKWWRYKVPSTVFVVHDVPGNILAASFLMAIGDAFTLGPTAVHPDYRRRNFGRAVVSAVLGRYRMMGGRSVRVVTSPGRVSAIALYEKVGFKHFSQGG